MIRKGMILMTILGVLLGCAGCAAEEAPEENVLSQRRDAAESYMRQMATYMWRAEEDIYYTRSNKILTDEELANYTGNELLVIKAGRLYRGIPYSYAGASAWNFYDYASEPDAQGITTISDVHWRGLNGSSSIGACVGNDCSGAIELAWNYVGSNIHLANTTSMTKNYGYIPVGDYVSNALRNDMTAQTCEVNGTQVMAQSYAALQKADAVVMRTSSYGHTMMVVENHTVLTQDEFIDMEQSYITVLHQTSSYMKKEHKEYDPEYGEDVYTIYGIDDKYTYAKLYQQGYLPITCNVFLDPAPVAEVYVTDTIQEHSYDTILMGSILSNRILSAATITITDPEGNVVMEGTTYETRQTGQQVFSFRMERFTELKKELQRGNLDLEALPSGNYHCTHVVRDGHGVEYTVRDFDFTK